MSELADAPEQDHSAAPLVSNSIIQQSLLHIASRFFLAYMILYCLPGRGRASLLAALPVVGWKWHWLAAKPWLGLCSWVAVHGFRLSGPPTKFHPTGSGDTTLDYIQIVVFSVLAALSAIAWSAFERSRRQAAPYPWVLLVVRLTVGFTLLYYGFRKIYPTQFPAPDFSRLTETYGESSPMGLLWTFMGASRAYEMFSGLMEAVAGTLLLFRRTSTLGALFATAVMLNIVVLNFCYDVPVKLYSLHLLWMSLFLLVPDVGPLWEFFVLRRTSRLEGVSIPRFERRWSRITAVVAQIVVVISIFLTNIFSGYTTYKETVQSASQRTPLYGMWDADSVNSDGARTQGDFQWRRVMVDRTGRIGVRTVDDRLLRFTMVQDQSKQTLKIRGWRNDHAGEFSYQLLDQQHLLLVGTLDHQPLRLQFHHSPPREFLLTTRGFHWISEDPYNL